MRILIILIIVTVFQVNDIFSQTYTRLTNRSGWDYSPAWSHDGTKIAFTSDRGGNKHHIYIYSLIDSSINKLELTDHQNWVYFDPAWSSDDKKIAFSMSFDYTYYIGCEIYVVSSAGGIPTKLTNLNGFPTTPYWSPDDSLLLFGWRPDLFTEDEDIYIIPSKGGSPQKILDNIGYSNPCWSPDGKKIAFCSSDLNWENYDIFIRELSTGNTKQITSALDDWHPTWSLDGKWIAFTGILYSESWPEWNIFVVLSEGGPVVQLTETRRDGHFYWNLSPSWSPTGDSLVFFTYNQPDFGDSDIWILSDFFTNIKSKEIEKTIHNKFVLEQNYPNPFNSSTTIFYSLRKSAQIRLKIYDLRGRAIKTLVNEYQNSNTYSITFNASDLASGIYYYQLQIANEFTETKKMLLLRSYGWFIVKQ